jgi:Fur family ferric uptake transcriptional regulator
MGAMHVHPEPATVPSDDLTARLRARGLRVTAQREQVLDAVRQLGHATPEQIGDAVSGVDVTTVYRTLELLEQLGLVKHTHLGHGAPSYRPAEDDHIHVVCHSCGSVVDAPPDLVDALERRLHDERDFHLDRAHFTVFGRCGRCVDGDVEADVAAGPDAGVDPRGTAHAEQSTTGER